MRHAESVLLSRERQAALRAEKINIEKTTSGDNQQRTRQATEREEVELYERGSEPSQETLSQSGAKAAARQRASLAARKPPQPRPAVSQPPSRDSSPLEEGMAQWSEEEPSNLSLPVHIETEAEQDSETTSEMEEFSPLGVGRKRWSSSGSRSSEDKSLPSENESLGRLPSPASAQQMERADTGTETTTKAATSQDTVKPVAADPEEPEEIPTIKPPLDICGRNEEAAMQEILPGVFIGKGLTAYPLGCFEEAGFTDIISFGPLLSPASLDRLLLGEADFEEREWLQLRTALLNFLELYEDSCQVGGRVLVLTCPVALLLTSALLVYQGYAEQDIVATVVELRQRMGLYSLHPDILQLLFDWRTATSLWAEEVRQATEYAA